MNFLSLILIFMKSAPILVHIDIYVYIYIHENFKLPHCGSIVIKYLNLSVTISC